MANIRNLVIIFTCFGVIFYNSLFSYGAVSLAGALIKTSFSTLTLYWLNSLLQTSKLRTVFIAFAGVNFAFLCYLSLLFGRFTSGMFASAMETNLHEMTEHLLSLDISLVLISLLLSILLCYSLHRLQASNHNRYLIIANLACMLLLGATHVKKFGFDGTRISETVSRTDGEELVISIFSANANTLLLSTFYEYQVLSNIENLSTPSQWKNVSQLTKPKDVYLVIIGESAMKSHFELYGYDRPTNSELNQLETLTLVSNPIAPSPLTRTSLPRVFNINDVKTIDYSLNIIELAKQAGFSTYWISNQGVVGNHDTPISAIAKHADHYRFLNSNYELAKDDTSLIPELKRVIQVKESGSKLIFLHTMGSHNDFCDRLSETSERLTPATLATSAECYDNTILNTVKLLSTAQKALKQQGVSYKLVYFSDHGLVKIKHSPYLSHSAGKLFSTSALEVPLLFIDDEPVQEKRIQATYYLSNFPHTFADWLGIEAEQIDYRLSILSPDFDASLQSGLVIDDGFNLHQLP